MWSFFPSTILNSEREYNFPPYNFTWQRVFLPCYNSNHGTWLERVGGGGMWPLGYKSSFFMFGE